MSLAIRTRRTLAAALVAVAVVPAVTSAHAGSAKTIKLTAETTQRNVLDLGESGFTLGDQVVFSDDLRTRKGGKPTGTDGGNCTLIRVKDAANQRGTVQCRVTYALDGGQITTQGLFELTGGGFQGTQTAAITGGTGHYRKARGEATGHFVRPGLIEVTLDLR